VLVIALPKGRLLDPSLELLDRAAIRFDDDVPSSRKLIFESTDKRFRAILVKPADIPTYVEYGAADIGIAGRDVLLESHADVLQPLDLSFGHCKIAVAGRKRSESSGTDTEFRTANSVSVPEFPHPDHPTVRVATKYPRITMDHFNSRGIPVEIISLSGSIELAPLIGLADRIVDVVETGRTLKENGLEILEVIAETSARLLLNRAGYQTKREEVLKFIQALESARR
jgi:ATP phosphoribosyltransferase